MRSEVPIGWGEIRYQELRKRLDSLVITYTFWLDTRDERYQVELWNGRFVCIYALFVFIHINIVTEINFWFKSVCIFSYESSWILLSFLFVLCENMCSLLWIGEVYIGEISFQVIIFRIWFSPTDWNKHKPNSN